MTLQTRIAASPAPAPAADPGSYLEVLGLLERLHRLLLDLIKDEFERLHQHEINPVQALLLYNIGGHEVSVGELKSRGYYQGSNVSYNLKKLVDLGFMHQQRSVADRRSIRVRLTEKGLRAREIVSELFIRHAATFAERERADTAEVEAAGETLRGLERFWSEQIRYIY